MVTSARPKIAEERKRSHWNPVRPTFVMPIGAIVAVAIVCVVVAVLTSAQRADDVSFNREQQLIQQAIADRGARVARELESVAATERATEAIRVDYDPLWVEHRFGGWLQAYFHHDLVVVLDGFDQIKYANARSVDGTDTADLHKELADSLNLLRGRLDVVPDHVIAAVAGHYPQNPGREWP